MSGEMGYQGQHVPTTGQPQAPPPGYAPPGQYPPPAAAPKKKGKGCIIGCVVVLLLLCGCLGAGAFGASLLFKPKDLGVRYTEADYWSAMEKAGVEVAPPLEGDEDWSGTGAVYSGSRPIDATFTDSEVSAWLSYSHMGGWPVREAQVRFTGGDGVQASGYGSYGGVDYPFYIDATAGISGRTLSGSLNAAEVLGAPVPAEYYAPGEGYALQVINSRLARLEGLDIQTAEVVDGQLRLVGTVPAKVERAPGAGQ